MIKQFALRSACALLVCTTILAAQGTGVIPVHSSLHRVQAIVPMIGKGTFEDPIRPMFVPASGLTVQRSSEGTNGPGARTGIISYAYQMSDDGKSALVEFVSMDREGLREILESKVVGVVAFEQGRHAKADVESAFKAKKRNFDFSQLVNKVR